MTLQGLLNLRLAGKRPSDMVFVTLVPELLRFLPDAIPVGVGNDFAPLAGLPVCVCFHSAQLIEVFAIVDKLLGDSPEDLLLWGLDSGLMMNVVECGHRGLTQAIPNETLRPILEALKCDS